MLRWHWLPGGNRAGRPVLGAVLDRGPHAQAAAHGTGHVLPGHHDVDDAEQRRAARRLGRGRPPARAARRLRDDRRRRRPAARRRGAGGFRDPLGGPTRLTASLREVRSRVDAVRSKSNGRYYQSRNGLELFAL